MGGHNFNVLMFGWEFPPFNSGGLGTACYGLTRALARLHTDITFILPRKIEAVADHMKITFADNTEINATILDSLLNEYTTVSSYADIVRQEVRRSSPYGRTLFEEVYRYGIRARDVAKNLSHNIIHAHDWLSFQAGIEAKKQSGKPLVTHVHATEFDRACNDNVHQGIYRIEKQGMEFADRIIAVSHYTKQVVIRKYNISAHKIDVVHNGVDFDQHTVSQATQHAVKDMFGKVVLFVGRITMQKGADYFLRAAQKVLQHYDDVVFVVAGSGDMHNQIVSLAAQLGISHKVFFTGFVRGRELSMLYKSADLYVLPSVSEPFGIVALEAIAHKTPVLISRQSGVSEVLNHSLKVNFWDTTEMANKMLAVLKYPSLQQCLSEYSLREVHHINWNKAANHCLQVYQRVFAHL